MLSKEKMARINELARKSKTSAGLSAEEATEQNNLRQEYLKTFRGHMDNHLHQIKIVDPKGNDVTPDKLKQSKKMRKNQS
ncbi:MAG: DUF896 domain-containing protein [Culicoidibacterales bacterium]